MTDSTTISSADSRVASSNSTTTTATGGTTPATAGIADRSGVLATHTLVACWLGMVFDGMDTNNFILTMHPALKELLHTTSDATIGFFGANIIAIFMIGWAVGAIGFGLLADRIGRARTLVATVLLYAIATGMCSQVHSWQELAVLRFLVGCGIGGEISIGGVILAELWKGRSRLHATAFLQTGFPCGLLMLAGINLLIGQFGWRSLYVVGMVPAILAIYMRMKLDDPQDFKDLKEHRQSLLGKSVDELDDHDKKFLRSPLLDLFRGECGRKVLVAVILSSCVCIGAYAVLSWMPPWVNQLMGTVAVKERSFVAISQSLGNIAGAATAGYVIALLGRRWAFRAAFVSAMIVCAAMFLTTHAFGVNLLAWAFFAGFFVFAPFSYLFIYIPELFETRQRATAFAFCIQAGRVLCAAACLASGLMVAGLFGGSYAAAGACFSLVYLIGLVATMFMPASDGNVSRQF
jgi:MFS family permease